MWSKRITSRNIDRRRRLAIEQLGSRDLLTQLGDFNQDGRHDTEDIDALSIAVAQGDANLQFDVDRSGAVDVEDLREWRAVAATLNGFAAPYSLGDANLDGIVDAIDLNAVATNWLTSNMRWSGGNFVPDSIVGARDLNELGINWEEQLEFTKNDFEFMSFEELATADRPWWIVQGDFNGDDAVDLAVAAARQLAEITVHLGNGDGTFRAPLPTKIDVFPKTPDTGDFDGDGNLDLAIPIQDTVTILRGNGDGTFVVGAKLPTSPGTAHALPGDYNGDGILDLAIAETELHRISVHLGTGEPALGIGFVGFDRAFVYQAGSHPVHIVTDDFDQNGTLDLAVADRNWGQIRTLKGNGDGTFQESAVVVGDEVDHDEFPIRLSAVDFNQDGLKDLVSANSKRNYISVFLGDGNGSFVFDRNVRTGWGPQSLATGDFNGDGQLDVATPNGFSDNIFVILNDGDGVFSKRKVFTADNPVDVVAGDFNTDGVDDLAVALRDNELVILTSNPSVGSSAFWQLRREDILARRM